MAGTRRKRQSTETYDPVFIEQLNFTDEQIALCGDDEGCLFDFVVTGEAEVARATMEDNEDTATSITALGELDLYSQNSTY